MSPLHRVFRRASLAALAVLACALAAAPARLAIVPFNNQNFNFTQTRLALAVRDELVARLTLNWDAQILSRSAGFALLTEDQLADAAYSGDSPRIPAGAGADYIVLGNFNITQSRKGVQLTIGVTAVGEKSRTVLTESMAFENPEPMAIADKVADLIAGKLKLSPRDATRDGTGSKNSSYAILPPRVFGASDAEAGALAAKLQSTLELGLQDSPDSPSIVERARLEELLRERRIASADGLTENLAGHFARLVGADEMIVANLNKDGRAKPARWQLRLVTIDARNGAITRVARGDAATPDEALSLASRMAAALPGTPRIPVDLGEDNPVTRRQESAIYARWAKSSKWSESAANAEVGATVRLELAEAALQLNPDMPPLSRFTLARNVSQNICPTPKALAPYENHYDPEPPPRLKRMTLELVSRILEPVIASTDQDMAQAAIFNDLDARIQANEPNEVIQRLAANPNARFLRTTLLVQAYLLLNDIDKARAYEERLPANSLEQCQLHALLAAARGDGAAEFDWLMRRATLINNRKLAHLGWDQRTIYLSNFHLPPAERIKLIDEQASHWGQGADVAQYTYIRARAELGYPDPGYAALEKLRKEFTPSGTSPGDRETIRKEIDRILAARPAAPAGPVRYADIQPLPAHLRVYIQPLGDPSPAIIARAAEKVEWFIGAKPVVLPSLPLPKHADVFYADVSEYNIGQLHRLVSHGYPIPADAHQVSFVMRDEIVTGRGSWIYAQVHDSGLHYVSYYRWARSSNRLTDDQIGDTVAKSILAGLQMPWRTILRPSMVELIGVPNWPNHAGTIQHSRGSSMDVVAAPFTICADTQKLYAAITADALLAHFAEKRRPENLLRKMATPTEAELEWLAPLRASAPAPR